MDREAREYIYRGAQLAGLDKFLDVKPLKGLEFLPNLRGVLGEALGGRYNRREQVVSVNTMWPATTYGARFVPGEVETIAETARTSTEAMRYTFVHELGHHVHRQGGAAVDTIIEEAFVHPERNPITRYAKDLPAEYFAECLAAYTFHRTALQAHDPVGYNMVVDVLTTVGVLP